MAGEWLAGRPIDKNAVCWSPEPCQGKSLYKQKPASLERHSCQKARAKSRCIVNDHRPFFRTQEAKRLSENCNIHTRILRSTRTKIRKHSWLSTILLCVCLADRKESVREITYEVADGREGIVTLSLCPRQALRLHRDHFKVRSQGKDR
jgi:hypothetical protein